MYKERKPTPAQRIVTAVTALSFILVMALSAASAYLMYRPGQDLFTSSLCDNLALLCKAADPDMSETMLEIIRHADVKSIRYSTDNSGNRIFYAKLSFSAPKNYIARYDGSPQEYFRLLSDGLYEGNGASVCEIYGLCGESAPTVDVGTLETVIQAAEKAWDSEKLTDNNTFRQALTDAIIPEPYAGRAISESEAYQSSYQRWLSECSSRLAAEGFTVYSGTSQSGETEDIQAALEEIMTPYLCSLRDITLTRHPERKGIYRLSFTSLDVIGTLSAAKSPSVAAIRKLAGVYTSERAINVDIDIDIARLCEDGAVISLPFFNLVRAMTKYTSGLDANRITIKKPETSQVISGKSDGQWPVEFRRAKGDGYVIINVIRIDVSGAESSVMKIFLTDGGSLTVCLSKGSYRLNMAVGTTYYGSTELFGIGGIYMRDTENIYTLPSRDLKTVTVAKQPGESMSLTDYLTLLGSDKSLIEKDEF